MITHDASVTRVYLTIFFVTYKKLLFLLLVISFRYHYIQQYKNEEEANESKIENQQKKKNYVSFLSLGSSYLHEKKN